MNRARTPFVVSLALIGISISSAAAGADQPFVVQASHHDVSKPLREIVPAEPVPGQESGKEEAEPVRRIHPFPFTTSEKDPVLQETAGAMVATTPLLNFPGVGAGFNGPQGHFVVTVAPPDTNGAAGSTQYVQWVNLAFAIFNKATGSPVYGPALGNSLWSGFGGACEAYNNGDPIVQYDKLANRWVLTQFATNFGPPFHQCVAVSTTSDATGSYYRYDFQYNDFNDYPKLGVWPDGYYLSFNRFLGSTFLGGEACAFDRAAMLVGAAATQQCFQVATPYGGFLPSDLDGKTLPPAGAPNHFVALDANALQVWDFHVDWTTPANSTFTGPVMVPVAPFSEACGGSICIPEAGSTQKLDGMGDRLMYRLAYRNFGDHESIVATHSVVAGASVGARWYELRDLSGTPTLYQQGTYAPDAIYRWLGSIAMDAAGNMALGYSASAASLLPAVRFTGRETTDSLGTMQAESSIFEGLSPQTNTFRWGDYSAMTIDPVDDCTFWYTNEYLSGARLAWSTRIASFKFPPPGEAAFTQVTHAAGVTSLNWSASPRSASSDVLRGSLSGLPVGPGGADEVCLANNTLATSVTDGATPPVGTGYWYLVRGDGGCGKGSWGFPMQGGAQGAERVTGSCS